MASFIAKSIIAASKESVEAGKAKYNAYFVNTKIYAKFKPDVDAILVENDCETLIN